MKKTLITGLIAFALISTVGTALAGSSQIGVKTYSEWGGIDATYTIMPQYYADHGFVYISDVETPHTSQDVGTETIVSVPNAPGAGELVLPTTFFQNIFVGEVNARSPCDDHHGPGGHEVEAEGGHHYGDFDFWDMLIIEDIASDDGQDDAYHSLTLEVEDCKSCDDCDPDDCCKTAFDVSKDVSITTGWQAVVGAQSPQEDYFVMTQDIYVDTLADCCADAYGELCSFNTYGGDYIFDIGMWGTGIDYEFDWIIGTFGGS